VFGLDPTLPSNSFMNRISWITHSASNLNRERFEWSERDEYVVLEAGEWTALVGGNPTERIGEIASQ